jgi:hypothetical protein
MDSTEKPNDYERAKWILDYYYVTGPRGNVMQSLSAPQRLAERLKTVRVFHIGNTLGVGKEIEREIELVNRLYQRGDRLLGEASVPVVRARFKGLNGVPVEDIGCWNPRGMVLSGIPFFRQWISLFRNVIDAWEFCDEMEGLDLTALQSKETGLWARLLNCDPEYTETANALAQADAVLTENEVEDVQARQDQVCAAVSQEAEYYLTHIKTPGSALALASLQRLAKSINKLFVENRRREITIYETHNAVILQTELAQLGETTNGRVFVSAQKHHFEVMDYYSKTNEEYLKMQKNVDSLYKGLQGKGVDFLTFIPKEPEPPLKVSSLKLKKLKEVTKTFLHEPTGDLARVEPWCRQWSDLINGRSQELARDQLPVTAAGRNIEGPD